MPDIKVQRFHLCGELVSAQSQRIHLESPHEHRVTQTEQNKYCFDVLPGKYELWVENLEYLPRKRAVTVEDTFILD